MSGNNGRGRRNVLKKIGGTTIAGSLLFAGTGAAENGDNEPVNRNISEGELDTGVATATLSSNSLTTQSNGTQPVTIQSNDVNTSNVTDVAHFSTDLDLTNGSGTVDYGTAEGHLTLYRAVDQIDDEYVYFIWHHLTAYPEGGTGYTVSIQEMEAHVDVTDDDFRVIDFDPKSSESIDEKEHTFSASVTLPNGSGASVGGNYYVKDGTVYPKNFDQGSGGEFGVYFDGDGDNAQSVTSMNGVCEIRSETEITDDTYAWPAYAMDPKLRVAADGHVDPW
ncbi:hypothetical protein SAMN04489841_4492 [Natrinema salaciae]|uniref:Uncharacterized protein n=2 Tax=Natrinema salaciae TaxID=1186196 RepID=A0A1H9RP93_9EURY|nr:hypothetical protein SAMN04489841_4492 [Natrinema salaciae]